MFPMLRKLLGVGGALLAAGGASAAQIAGVDVRPSLQSRAGSLGLATCGREPIVTH